MSPSIIDIYPMKKFYLTIKPSEKIKRIKELVSEKINLKVAFLFYRGRKLDDNKTLGDYCMNLVANAESLTIDHLANIISDINDDLLPPSINKNNAKEDDTSSEIIIYIIVNKKENNDVEQKQ